MILLCRVDGIQRNSIRIFHREQKIIQTRLSTSNKRMHND